MKLVTTLYLVLLGIFAIVPLHGQVPGYLGKRISLEYSAELGAALQGVTQNNTGFGDVFRGRDDFSQKSFGLSYNHNAKVSFVLTRHFSIGVQASQYYTGLTTNMETQAIVDPSEVHSHTNFHRLNIQSLGLNVMHFVKSRGALAPLGAYFSLGFDRMKISGEILDRVVYERFESDPISEYNLISIDQNMTLNSFSFSAGNNRIFFDRFIFKIGVIFRIPILFEGFSETFRSDYFTDPRFETDPNQVIFEMDTFNRLLSHNIMKLEIGFGILL